MDLTLIIPLGILIGCLIALSWFAGSDAPYVPTKMDHIRKILKLAGVKKGKKFYELGSGDGRVVLEAAKLGADAVGIEQSWIRVLYSRWKTYKHGQNNAIGGNCQFYHGNIFSSLRGASATKQSTTWKRLPRPAFGGARNDIRNADVIYIYLLSKGVQRLEPLLKNNLKKGTHVITQTYHFPNWKPYKKDGNFWLYHS